MPLLRAFFFLPIVAALLATPLAAQDRWEEAIQAFEAKDRVEPPATNGIAFIGSSSIRRWDLAKYFPGLPVYNRGFGGSQIADSVRYADRILLPHKPRIVVLYAGDNDIASGKTPETVLADFQSFVSKVQHALPKTRVVFIAIKPSIRRWALIDTIRRTNQLIHEVIQKDPLLEYVDVDKPMIGTDGMPRSELFVDDGLHLSDEGNSLWASLVKPYLK